MIASAAPQTALPTNLVTVDEFEQWERHYGRDGRDEFIQGQLIPKPGMKQDEFDIADFLQRQFSTTAVYQQKHVLLAEADSYVDGVRKRIPDLAYFTAEQRQAIRQGQRVSTLFAIELLSDSESHQNVVDKTQDYFDGGAQLVWNILPPTDVAKNQKIEAYTSPENRKIYKGQDTISAAPVIPEFEFTVADLFA
jgi:Uma2 family endonuclease